MWPSSNHFELNDRTYRMITDFIYKNSGLRFDETTKFLVQKRVSNRIRELNIDSFEKYYYYLVYHPNRDSELDHLLDLITTHETYFFREERQLSAFDQEILPQILSEKNESKTLRIWSAGCATGEEPYSIAILCAQKEELQGWEVDIFASDISQRVIHRARQGIYPESSFRSTLESFRDRYFVRVGDHQYRIQDHLRQMVTFGKLNLLDEQKAGLFGELDVIFCRNVIIYFDIEAKKKVIENLYQRLRRNGFLLLGHSESLLSLSTRFRLVHLKNDMVYQK
ncbi:MAG TPA: protein-glutamate O-methyltransferase CheR [Acidobacteriota bacterium]|nr:protein-glutamate O-methyltransferase CheR [Acidobacteriota bacterium]